ncbi:DUF5412 family protein [Heyndrickxia oleronia]|uniref:DUF5412 family protein n=1 Tax=Heyndrickxia oleronia TaxID=38875 RepID=A0AAW6SVW2_9BACI|nr:DUF5412 family protein [Heyndrickxia oleronia]MDH5162298.1 DUF5412 family protein [Heyndrickxia oleronia]
MHIYLHFFIFFTALFTLLIFITFCFLAIGNFIKKKPFPKRLFTIFLSSIGVVSCLMLYSTYFFTFGNLKGEFYKGPVISPTEKYVANAYYMTYGGAAGGVNIWVNITFKEEKNKIKTVYYSDAKSDFSINWIDDDNLLIVNNEPGYQNSDRSIKLKIGKEIYHENGLACRSLLMKAEFETCYHN